MRAKVRKYADVLEGRAIAVKAPKSVRDKYTTSGALEARGQYLIAQKEFENQRAKLRKGMLELRRRMKNGQEEQVILPFAITSIPDLIRQLREDDTLNGLKNGDELFSFRIYGHNARIGFEDNIAFANHVENHYKHLFSPKASKDAIRHLTFQRFKPDSNSTGLRNNVESGEPKTYAKGYEKANAKGRSGNTQKDFYQLKKDQVKAAKKRSARAKETPEQTEARKKADRERARQRRAK